MEFRLRKLGFPHDQTWMTADGAAAAVWFPPPGTAQAPGCSGCGWCRPWSGSLAFGPYRCWVVSTAWRPSIRTIRRIGYPYILGAEQAPQARGLGSALLAHTLARVDADRMPTYLESSHKRNIALYDRHGFRVTSELTLPNGPRIWPMWRPPRR
jgi:GNAT superfamily N-acetyltransferase